MSFKNLNFFGTPNRFQKTMKRGVYFACFIYHRDRVLVTNEEVLPIVEIGKNVRNDCFSFNDCLLVQTKTFPRPSKQISTGF